MKIQTRKNAFLILVAGVLAAASLTGCKDTPSAGAVQWQLERQIPGLRLERESHVRIPRIAMIVARKIMRLAADEDEEGLRVISHVKRVNVATYRVLSRPDGELETPVRFEQRLAEGGWELVVRQREDDEQTWIYYRSGEDKGAITNLYVVALDAEELTVVDLAGRIDRIFAEAFADDPGELVEIFGP